MSWWFSSSTTKRKSEVEANNRRDEDAEEKKPKIDKRGSTWIPGATATKAQHNLLNEEESPNDQVGKASNYSTDSYTKHYEAYLEARRISNRPLHIVRQSDADILRFKEENYKQKSGSNEKFTAISILPADEMNSLTSEIKLWHRMRKRYKIVFTLSILSGLGVLAVSMASTALWYSDYNFLDAEFFSRNATEQYNIHMNAQVLHLLVLTVALNIFRLFAQTKLTKVIVYHALIATLAFGISLIGVFHSIKHHEEFTHVKTHFFSLHSWIGLMTYLWYLFVFFTGFLIMYYPSNKLKTSHTVAAIMTFMLGSAASICGFFYRSIIQFGSKHFHISLSGIVTNSASVLVVIFCIFVRMSAASFVFRRRPRPQWDVIVYRSLEAIEDMYLEIHEICDSFEMWVKQVNLARLKALRVPYSSVRASLDWNPRSTREEEPAVDRRRSRVSFKD